MYVPTHRSSRTVLALTLLLLCRPLISAQPQLPCGQEAIPQYPSLLSPPVVTFWSQSGIGAHWQPPVCTGWSASGFSTLVTTVARFRDASDTDALLRRIGAISHLAGMRYWSTTHQRWQTLITEAHAVTGPQGSRRQDFSPNEMKEGAILHFEQTDNLAGKAVYRLRVAEASPNRIVFDVENVTTMRYLLLTLFHPGELQTIYFLDREAPDIWRYYGVVRSGRNASGLTTGKESSSINRAVAFFRHLAQIPDDLEPPAAK